MEHNHSGNTGKRILAALLFLVTLPFVVAGLIVFGLIYLLADVLPSPIEKLFYKRSPLYRDLGVGYSIGITRSFAYKSYKYVKANKSLDLVVQDEGYYYYKTDKAVLVLPYYCDYKLENGQWRLYMKSGGESISPEEIRLTFAPLIKTDTRDMEFKLLVKEKYFDKSLLSIAKSDPVFVFYKNYKDFASISA